MNHDDKSIFDFETPETEDSFALNGDDQLEFGHSGANDFINSDHDIADQDEPSTLMQCVCPKCAEKTEVDFALVPENGLATTCSSCNKQFHIVRESCACRAKRKSFEINCASCGKLLDQQPHCHSCGQIFPDYFVAFNPDAARRKARSEFFHNKWAAIRNLDISFRPTFKGKSHESASGYSPVRAHSDASTVASTGTSKLLSRRVVVLALSLIITVALGAAGAFAYKYHMSGKDYAENYFKTLYCMKTGLDSNVKASTSLKTEWESSTVSGRSFSPRIGNYDEAKSVKLHGEIDKYMQMMNNPPKRFAQANDSLHKYYNVYLESEALVQSKPASLQELGSLIDNLGKKTSTTAQEIKSNIPASLKQEFESAKLKYRGFKDF